jgi:ATP synthase protein I
VNLPENTIESSPTQVESSTGELSPEPNDSMQEFYQLQQGLIVATLVMTVAVFFAVWVFYSLNVALNYLIGSCTGVVYLRLLAKNVEQLGRQKRKIDGSARFALVTGIILVASKWDQLEIIPIFLGFLTYKVALIVYVFWTTFVTDSSST